MCECLLCPKDATEDVAAAPERCFQTHMPVAAAEELMARPLLGEVQWAVQGVAGVQLLGQKATISAFLFAFFGSYHLGLCKKWQLLIIIWRFELQ